MSLIRKTFNFFIRFKHTLSDFELQYASFKCVKTESIPLALYGGRHTVTMIPGTGIGPELTTHVRNIFKHLGIPVDFEVVDINPAKKDYEELNNALISIRRNGVAIKGNIGEKSERFAQLRNVIIRSELDLYVYVLPCKSYPEVPAKHKDIDIVLIKQNTEGEYSMLEHSIGGEKVVESLKIVRRDSSLRLATYAFKYAKKFNRKKVTTVHKANIMKLSDGLFLQIAQEVAKKYPEIEHTDIIIDNCCMQLVSNPQQFDVLLATNLYGSIIANVLCGMSGGPGLMSGKNYGEFYALFEPATRNSGDAIAGQNIANPVAMLNASVDLLYHLGYDDYGSQIKKAIFKTICEEKLHTPDLGGKATTDQIVDRILQHLLE